MHGLGFVPAVSDAPAPSYSAEQREVPLWKAEPPPEAGVCVCMPMCDACAGSR